MGHILKYFSVRSVYRRKRDEKEAIKTIVAQQDGARRLKNSDRDTYNAPYL